HYNSTLDRYIVSAGTGFIEGGNTLVQNENELDIVVGNAYYDYIVEVDEASKQEGASIVVSNGKYYLNTGNVPTGSLITVTLTGLQNVGGFVNKVSRAITFMVVDFYISSLQEGLVNNSTLSTTMRLAYINGKHYDLRIFDGVTNENLNTVQAITFNPNNLEIRTRILELINYLNGFAENNLYLGWSGYIEQEGTFAYNQLTPNTDTWINGNYQLIQDKNNGYRILSSGISDNSIIRYDLMYYYDNNGKFTVTSDSADAVFGISTGDITLNFYQVTSQEHPRPVRTLNEFIGMEANFNYVLLNDLDIVGDWAPINTEISSFNGNGYTINFSPTSINANDENFGLFGTVGANTVLKNINVKLSGEGVGLNDDVSSLSALNFGVIAGTNKGSIYNCEVNGLKNDTSTSISAPSPANNSSAFNIAGLVGVNQSSVTNSRVVYTDITASGNVSGLVVQNTGVISGCYYTGGTITNQATSQNYATAGLVISNAYGASILGSFAGGTYTTTKDGEQILLDSASDVRDGVMQSGVTTAGLVYENSGDISDCYTGMKIFSTKMSGFVFTNYASGKIKRCYSTSDLSSTGSIFSSYPFIGVESTSATTNNNYNKTDGLVDCFYYDTGFASTRLEEAKILTKEDFLGQNGTSGFTNFVFSRTGESGAEFTGVWTFVDENNLYFTPERFETKLRYASVTDIPQTNFGPKLVNASLIATPRMELAKAEVNEETGEVVYTYTKKYPSYFANHTYDSNDPADYDTDYTYDPVVVSNMAQFNEAFDTSLSETYKIDGVVVSDIRIITDLKQSDLSQEVNLITPRAEYAGILEGNGFAFSGLNLAVNDGTTERYGLIGTLKLVEPASTEINHIGTIKNYNVDVLSVSCSTVAYVGAVAGVVESANLYNVNVTGVTSRVIGNNAVGGVAGLVSGTSRIINVTSNVGVTANYRADTSKLYNKDLLKVAGLSESVVANDISKLGYAGGLFGIVDITQFDATNPTSSDNNEARVVNVTNSGNASIVGKISGGIAGLVGVHSVIHTATKVVAQNSMLRGYVFAGGIAGQNNGYIKYGVIKYADDIQNAVDQMRTGEEYADANVSFFQGEVDNVGTGGLVGLNIGVSGIGWPAGTIMLSSSKVAVRNATSANVGGLVGVAYGGDIRACFATGSVIGNKTAYVGGLVGYVSDFSDTQSILPSIDNPFGSNSISAGTTLDYVVGLNNYFATDYNYYHTLFNNESAGRNGAIGGLIGYCYDGSLLYTTHAEEGNESDLYSYLSNSINYFVNQITDKIQENSVIERVTNGNFIDLNQENETGEEIADKAVGK
ncbi:MAG: hypothetical protein J6C13_02630, partial [Clostridia bacterium]|nr:hypothetical protein [Clostridia bacterium]